MSKKVGNLSSNAFELKAFPKIGVYNSTYLFISINCHRMLQSKVVKAPVLNSVSGHLV
jgi:hypothetical protein